MTVLPLQLLFEEFQDAFLLLTPFLLLHKKQSQYNTTKRVLQLIAMKIYFAQSAMSTGHLPQTSLGQELEV